MRACRAAHKIIKKLVPETMQDHPTDGCRQNLARVSVMPT